MFDRALNTTSLKPDFFFPNVWEGADGKMKFKVVLLDSVIPRKYLRPNVDPKKSGLSSPGLFFL